MSDTDPILNEIYKRRREYSKRFDYNLEKMFDDIKQREQKRKGEGWKFVSFAPTRPKKEAA